MLTAGYRGRDCPHDLTVSGISRSHLRAVSPHCDAIVGSIDMSLTESEAAPPHRLGIRTVRK